MKITFILTQSIDSPSGLGRFFPLASALTQLGYEVTLLALHHDYRNAKRLVYDRDGVHVRYVGQMHVRKTGNKKTYYHPLAMVWIAFIATLKLTWWSMRIPADLIQVCKPQPMNSIAAWWVHIFKHTPVVIDSDDYEAGSNRFSGHFQQRVVAMIEDWVPSFATGIIAGNQFVMGRYTGLGFPAYRMIVLHNGVDRRRFEVLEDAKTQGILDELRASLNIDCKRRIIVYIGSMSGTDHPVDTLLDALAMIVERVPDALLILVGGGEDYEYFRQYAISRNLSENAIFTGRVPAEKVPYYYALAEVTVDPRRDTDASQSSLSLKLVESIAAGVPCITTDIGDRAAVLDGAGIAVRPNDAQAIAEAVITVLCDEHTSSQIRNRASEIRHNVYWDHRAVIVQAYYGSLIGEPSVEE